MVWNLFPFKGDFSLRKARSCGAPHLSCRGTESPGSKFDVLPKNSSQGMMHGWTNVLSWQSCQSAVAHSCSLLNPLDGFPREMFKLKANFDADLLLYLLSHFECDGHTAQMLTQWHLPLPLTRTVGSSLFMCVVSSPFSLAAWIMATVFPDRPHIIFCKLF